MRLQIPHEYATVAKLLTVVGLVAAFAAYLAFLGEKALVFGYVGFFVGAVLLGVGLIVLAARATTLVGELTMRR